MELFAHGFNQGNIVKRREKAGTGGLKELILMTKISIQDSEFRIQRVMFLDR